jgi:hypothetical protein
MGLMTVSLRNKPWQPTTVLMQMESVIIVLVRGKWLGSILEIILGPVPSEPRPQSLSITWTHSMDSLKLKRCPFRSVNLTVNCPLSFESLSNLIPTLNFSTIWATLRKLSRTCRKLNSTLPFQKDWFKMTFSSSVLCIVSIAV